MLMIPLMTWAENFAVGGLAFIVFFALFTLAGRSR